MEEEDLVRLLYCLQKAVKDPGSSEEILITNANSQLVVNFIAQEFSFFRRSFTTLQTIIRKYKGDISINRTKRGMEVMVFLPLESRKYRNMT